ncbi:peptidylprolyl isomerase [Methyloradius palustris]|uniref:Peptidyl-prolyl cis-trans isomerase n=1 Tax=Methyloradius palustris TaxID=2778876 RepID=A0A8D5GDQ4_9PROT|nr:peptidyl-prolyl cis-trans isomerase [Methyloradius palustris]
MSLNSIKHLLLSAVAALSLSLSISAMSAPLPVVEIKTNMGTILVELNSQRAPVTVANFLQYVKDKQYDNTIFHRVISGFMIQGGGFTKDLVEKPTRSPIKNEADNGLTNSIGAIAMARTGDPQSATAQFYINVANNVSLDYTEASDRGWGYAVFGKVVQGMDVVLKISKLPTDPSDTPLQTVVIQSITLKDTPEKK